MVSKNLLPSKCLPRLSPFPCTPWLEEVKKVERCEKTPSVVSKNLADSIVIVMGVCIKMREKDRNDQNRGAILVISFSFPHKVE